MRMLNLFLLVVTAAVSAILFAISLPLSSPHIFGYCLLSQMGTVPVDDDAFRVFCLRGPTDSGLLGVDDQFDKLVHTLKEYDTYDRILPQSGLNVDLLGGGNE